MLPHAVSDALKHRDRVQAVTFAPDGKRLATASWDGTVGVWDAIWDTVTRREIERWKNATAQLRFSADGKYLVSLAETTAAAWRWGADAQIDRACKGVKRNLTREEWRQFLGDADYRRTCSDFPEPKDSAR
jgi:hypothetical protein